MEIFVRFLFVQLHSKVHFEKLILKLISLTLNTNRERETRDKERAIEYFLMKSRWKQLYQLIQDNSNGIINF